MSDGLLSLEPPPLVADALRLLLSSQSNEIPGSSSRRISRSNLVPKSKEIEFVTADVLEPADLSEPVNSATCFFGYKSGGNESWTPRLQWR